MMVIFEVLSLTVFIRSFIQSEKKLNLSIWCTGNIQGNILVLTILRGEKSMFVCCFDHLIESVYLDTVDCLHYYNSVFY